MLHLKNALVGNNFSIALAILVFVHLTSLFVEIKALLKIAANSYTTKSYKYRFKAIKLFYFSRMFYTKFPHPYGNKGFKAKS
jgi:hypothetical protein